MAAWVMDRRPPVNSLRRIFPVNLSPARVLYHSLCLTSPRESASPFALFLLNFLLLFRRVKSFA